MIGRPGKTFLTTPSGLLGALFIYGLTHATMRLSASWNLGENDPVSLLNAQGFTMLWENPSVFDGLVWALSFVFGPSALIFQILRYGLLAVAMTLVFLSARRLLHSGFWAALTVEAYALIYQISWRFHEGFTYPLITIIAVSGTFWAYLRLEERWGKAALLFFMVTGWASGFWYIAFLASFLGAMLILKPHNWRIWTVLAVPVLGFAFLSFPPWTFGDGDVVSALGASSLKIIAYLSPLLPIVLVLFGFHLWRGRKPAGADIRHIALASLIACLMVVGAAGLTGNTSYGEHALMPLFFLTPIWIIDTVRRAIPSHFLIKAFTALCFTLMGVAFIVRAANFYVLDPVCNRCYFGIPYAGLAEKLHETFSVEQGWQIITQEPRLAGNLAARWPVTDKPSFSYGLETIKDNAGHKPVLLVWSARNNDASIRHWLEMRGLSKNHAAFILKDTRTFTIDWPHLWRPTGYRQNLWKAAPLNIPRDETPRRAE